MNLKAAQKKTVDVNVRCGQIRKAWVPGSYVKGRFVTHSKRASNLRAMAKQQKGKKATNLRKQATRFAQLNKTQRVACKQPEGSRKLAAVSGLKTVTKIRCGKIGSTWLPGTVKQGYFTSYTQQAKNLTKQSKTAKRAAKKRLNAQIKQARLKAKNQRAVCKHPNGAVKLAANARKTVNGVSCGKIGGTWQAGAFKAGGYFLSHTQAASNQSVESRSLKGAKKKQALRRAQETRKKASAENRKCNVVNKQPTPSTQPVPLKINTGGASGLALTDPNTNSFAKLRVIQTTDKAVGKAAQQPEAPMLTSATGSNLRVVQANGVIREAVTSGQAKVSKLLIAPNNKTYIVFQSRVNLDDVNDMNAWQNGCLLAEVVDAQNTVCIDKALQMISWPMPGMSSNAPIQFDSHGAIYYAGMDSSGKQVLKKYLNGIGSVLTNENMNIARFLVYGDGNVLLSGSNAGDMTSWIRLIRSTGGLKHVGFGSNRFMSIFPDNKIYLGISATSLGVHIYNPATEALESKLWIGPSWPEDVEHHNSDEEACPFSCAQLKEAPLTVGGEVFAISYTGNSSKLVKMYPNVQAIDLKYDLAGAQRTLAKPSLLAPASNALYVSGYDDINQLAIVKYDLATGATSIAGSGIDFYHLNPTEGGAKIMFDGLRFSDNQYVLGYIDTATNTTHILANVGTKWSDFQTYN